MRLDFRTALALALGCTIAFAPRLGADDDPVIVRAIPDLAAGTLTISGSNLDPHGALHVLLNGLSLPITSQSQTTVVVPLPPSVLATPGTYLLIVGHGREHARHDDDFAEFDVTIGGAGAIGPAGPQGPTGPQGLPGPQGPQGIQ